MVWAVVRVGEAEILRERALRMLSASEKHLSSGDYDLAAFLAEQAVQLFLKYKVFTLTGEIPRTHSLRTLLQVLAEVLSAEDEVRGFIRENRSLLIRLEEAYIASRYLFRRYEREETEELVAFARRLMEFVGGL